ncbi:bifunctional DNA-formamidopyrimidine glycosylase/DNA-(apurinic or apyrimidinic site) lyase [Fuchsiella alkaliacetigena]|uniref:bifunctional DNA-formamidopyrimidine glycosylase/DNA-(apurinic or apyrimidinic site) lyase n=1 Tax=Fuchsiella alkaliacetigena TaxID=957042 RepID=UPI00200A8D66|nr:bifunctional DNA-formamidopyrimidine glycosylase/DNA-(apurinic or apyrimidinic site) lyase [Fuchsiella alkaliacetigena]MCK8824014.1 bifunctional DNA-formamidopyrimidine glycosylase/DNA-(apurinic or apyrimidinic site) lyase [Fuchsiella alkaliacetigena]
MPELPEVQTVVDTLSSRIIGLKITEVEVKVEKLIALSTVADFKAELIGKEIKGVRRRGKYIIIELSDDKYLIVHLRMTGQLLYAAQNLELAKHTHVIISFANQHQLRFINKRKFGRIYLVSDFSEAGSLAELGPEPLSEDFTLDTFKALFENRRGIIKNLLLNQKFLAGLGNIYVDEALYLAGIHPLRKADQISEEELAKLYQAIRKVLKDGIKHRGTTKWDYVDGSGQAGEHQDYLQVYDRKGKNCYDCAEQIEKIKVSGRGTYFCPECQLS